MDEADDGSDSDRDEPAEASDGEGSLGADDRPGEERGSIDGESDVVGAIPDDVEGLREEVRRLHADLADLEEAVDDRTVHRSAVESELKQYVRRRLRRGHARGWGPYLVLLYGTAMTLGAFYSPVLSSGWAIFAMFVIWLSTLGLYVLMVLVGVGIGLLGAPGKALDAVRKLR